LASQSSQIINYSKLGQQIGLTFEPLKKYLWYAEKTFLIKPIRPYFTNKQKELTKSPVIYFNDLGLRNFSIDMMGELNNSLSLGLVFQNLILQILEDKISNSTGIINYWRTITGKEVDFIINKGGSIIPVETKYSHLKDSAVEKPLLDFINKYNPKEALVVNLSLKEEKIINKTTVRFVPFYKIDI